jgi:hypothetical protein
MATLQVLGMAKRVNAEMNRIIPRRVIVPAVRKNDRLVEKSDLSSN